MIRIALFLLAAAFALPSLAADLPLKSYAQELVDETVAKNPDLLVIMMHATPPNSPDDVVIASNIGRIGKKSDEDDMRVKTTQKNNLEVAHGGTRFEVELPLQEVSGITVGALGLVFAYKEGQDKAAMEKKATKIRDEIGHRFIHVKNLCEVYPYDPSFTTKTHAQKIVDATLAKHKELLVLAFHVSPPGISNYPIIASNIGRIGKKADEDDMGVINTGKPVQEVNAETHKRFEVETQLKDATGKVVGAASYVFPYKEGDDESQYLKKAEVIGAEMSKQIPSLEKLVELDP